MNFYKGAMARELAAEMQRGGGLITAEDLAEYEVKERAADPRQPIVAMKLSARLRPALVAVTMLEALNILEGYDLGKPWAIARLIPSTLPVRPFAGHSLIVRNCWAIRTFSQIPVAQLIDKNYAEGWRESLDMMRATDSKDMHRPSGFGELDRRPGCNAILHTGRPKPNNTTHYSVVDPDGNAVSVTTTLNESFGSAVTAGKLGFLLNDEMDDFTSKPGVPNGYGLIQGEANAIAPGKRPLSAMAPTIVLQRRQIVDGAGFAGRSAHHQHRRQYSDGRD